MATKQRAILSVCVRCAQQLLVPRIAPKSPPSDETRGQHPSNNLGFARALSCDPLCPMSSGSFTPLRQIEPGLDRGASFARSIISPLGGILEDPSQVGVRQSVSGDVQSSPSCSRNTPVCRAGGAPGDEGARAGRYLRRGKLFDRCEPTTSAHIRARVTLGPLTPLWHITL